MATVPKVLAPLGTLPENDFLLKQKGKGNGREQTSATMDVCFDGEQHRVQATFDVKLGSSAGKEAKEVDLGTQDDAATAAWVEEHLIGAAPLGPAKGTGKASVSLASAGELLRDDKPVRLADRLLIAKEEDDFLARMIRSDQKSYKELVEACASQVNTAMTSKEWSKETNSQTQSTDDLEGN